MCSDTERRDMLILLHISLFLMLHYSSNMNVGDIETIVLYNHSREMFYDLSLGKFDF